MVSPVSALGVSGYVIFWVLFATAFGLFFQRLYFLFKLMRLGKAENRFDKIGQRIKTTLVEVVPQLCNLKSVTRKDLAGIGHALLFWGFSFYLIGYIIFVGLAGGFGLAPVIEGTTFETVYFSILDIAGVAVVVALIWAAIRRYVIRVKRIEPTAEAGIILIVVFLLMALSVSIEGFGFASSNVHASWPPLGRALANFLSGSGISQSALEVTYRILWWLHYVVILGFMVYIPRSKHLHILLSPANIFFKSMGPKMELDPVPLEGETFGISRIQDFSWKDLLDLYACAVCGRCHANCPAQVSGKPLSPRDVVHNLKEHLLEAGPTALKAKISASPETSTEGQPDPPENQDMAMIGKVVTEQEIWDCTTCGACQEVCPVGVEHVRKIIGMRRNLVLMQSKMPETAQLMLRNMQTRGHPWAGVQSLRLRGDWTTGQDLKILGENDQVDVLFWVGCTGALVDRNVAATLSLVKVLKAAGISFGVLGEAEACCGDPARRAGYEFLFQTMAEQNIEVFKAHNVKEIITSCPHCYNTLKNEYKQYGADLKVVHYTELIAEMLKDGRLKLTHDLNSVLTYHDPCYLGRYNNIYSAPRDILRSISHVSLREMERSHNQSFCCGGGGGHMWIEENIGRKINEIRIEDAMKTDADTVVTTCPYCLQMLEEGIERKEAKGSLKIKDLSELVEKAL
jgi:Fe-S oxidoreductase